MNKYFEMFQKDERIDLSTLDLSTLTFEERYWVIACKAYEYMILEDRFTSAVCMTRIKELAFLNACALQIDSCGFLDEKYMPYKNKFEHMPNDQKLLKIDAWVNGSLQREKKLNKIGSAVLIFAIAVIAVLYFAFDVDFIISMAIGTAITVLGNSIIIPAIYKRKLKKNQQPEVLKGDAPEEIKDLINFDAKLNDIVKEEDYLPLLRARNEQELNEAIRNYPKK